MHECESPGMKSREPTSASCGTISPMFFMNTGNSASAKKIKTLIRQIVFEYQITYISQ